MVLEYPGAKYYLLQVNAPEIVLKAKPGQFCMLSCGPDTILKRPISIHTISKEDVFFLYSVAEENNHGYEKDLNRPTEPVSIRAKGKPWLSHTEKGKKIDIIGPLGNGFLLDKESKSVLLAAGGIGIAPLRFLAEESVKMRKHVTILLGARCNKGLLADDELPKEAKIIKITELNCRDSNILEGLLTKYLPDYYGEADRIYACGPRAMLETMSEQIKQNRITKPVQVSLEVRMGCGAGACYGCSIKTTRGMKRVCREGPVFDIKDIIWQEVSI
jgi:dihydroorotate dehydrogenase electron transfer subunit